MRRQAQWMRTGPRSHLARIAVDQRPGLSIVDFDNKAARYKDVYVSASPAVAPRAAFDPGSNNLVLAEAAAAAALGTPLHTPPVIAPLDGARSLLVRPAAWCIRVCRVLRACAVAGRDGMERWRLVVLLVLPTRNPLSLSPHTHTHTLL